MNETLTAPADFVTLYRRAFKEYGTQALWNMRPLENPTPAPWRSQKPCGPTAEWKADASQNALRSSAVPLTKLQSHVLRVLAAGRSPDSYIAGGAAINRDGPRFSGDIDIFQDTEQRLETAAQADAKALTDAGLKLKWKTIVTGKREAEVEGLGDRMPLNGER